MDENNNTSTPNTDAQTKKLSIPVQIAFLVTVCTLLFLYVSGICGAIGFILVPVAVAMNVLLAFEFDNSKAKLLVLLLINLIPFVAAGVYFQSVALSLGALYALMMSLPMWLTVRMGYGRSASIASAAICAMLVWCAGFALLIIAEYGAFNAQTLGALLDTMLEPYIDYLSSLFDGSEGEIGIRLTGADLDMIRYYFKTMFFGSVAVAMIVWSYVATLAVRLVASVFGVSHRIPRGYRIGVLATITKDGPKVEVFREEVVWRVSIDNITVAIYVASYIISVLFSPTGKAALSAYLVAINLVMILSPGFFYCGVRDALLSFRGKSATSNFGRIVAIIAAVLILVSPTSVVFIFSALGVVVTVRENRAARSMQKSGKE